MTTLSSQSIAPCLLAFSHHPFQLLNLGCGKTFQAAWHNVDLNPCSSEVRRLDLRKGLEFPDQVFDACYNSHVLEHLDPSEAIDSLSQMYRVLKPGGIVRIVVPDLEGVARLYLQVLERVEAGDQSAEASYEWMQLEMLDQISRVQPGGRMKAIINQTQQTRHPFILSRLGAEFELYEQFVPKTIWQKVQTVQLGQMIRRLRNQIARRIVSVIAGRNAAEAFDEGLFRRSGEVHRWMYDRHSLKKLLQEVGFEEVKVCRADESGIPNFNDYELDLYHGRMRKPDSLFIEAVRPRL
ncbi:MAG: methyltransferase domain-containing protein [Leptolyngbya sp. UWPOB_LEPTO1]|uniref:class I SAM-dependent methyltransferase n=1 Tax=Leptolyngbya sp. UWPOB_LEPTO1 TaxID=2815653 RepID=UPI001AD314DA|nr:methyltransferase domain-containing protein [Leptolyngbya sp. UWPOB_LEPTO1]MBN8560362.1 methyltransferase domain-containing protein [Leptolyngbya sp. UWPOB_LEPTO1]